MRRLALMGWVLVVVLASKARALTRRPEGTTGAENPLGSLVKDEVARAESDYSTLRTRAQAVLTVAGLLVTALAGLLVIALGRNDSLSLSPFTSAVVAFTLVAFVAASVIVLLIFLPSTVEWPETSALGRHVSHDWSATGWDQQVAQVLVTYLTSLRTANAALAKKLALAIFFQVLGILGLTLMVLTLLA